MIFNILLFALNLAQAADHQIEEMIPEAVPSYYSSKLPKSLARWPLKEIPDTRQQEDPIWIRGIRTPEKPNYIGLLKQVWLNAPISKVAALIEDFEAYPQLDEEVKKVKIIAREGNKFTVFWERNSPVFFVPNIKYEMIYLIHHESESRIIYRYQLKSGNSVKSSDGLIVLEAIGNLTKLTAFDFYDGSWGILGSLASGKIWKASLEGSCKGDFAFKAKLEHPTWTREQIKKETERILERYPIEPIEYLENFKWD